MLDVYVDRATQYSLARKLVEGEKEFIAALALFAVHSAISWNDAVLINLCGKRSKSEGHTAAIRATQKECKARGFSVAGIKHLQRLVKEKIRVSYSDEATTAEVAQGLAIASERFEEWARQILRSKENHDA